MCVIKNDLNKNIGFGIIKLALIITILILCINFNKEYESITQQDYISVDTLPVSEIKYFIDQYSYYHYYKLVLYGSFDGVNYLKSDTFEYYVAK